MRKKGKIYEDLCTGCGLCRSYSGKEMVSGCDGFDRIDLKTNVELLSFCENICPANGQHINGQENSTWGKYISVFEGYACNESVRYAAASGGMTTAVAMYLLDKGYADGVIHIGEDPNDPYQTKVFCSKTSKEVAEHSASRYVSSSPLSSIVENFEDGNGKYIFIGRPCDIITLNNFLNWNPKYKEKIYCTLSFFCAGAPSVKASIKLAETLGLAADNVKSIRYRGNGWPGKATVTDRDNQQFQMEYIDSWNEILGRDIRKICKFCSDGVGEAADISSGDLWVLGEKREPTFHERPGLNITFSRSALGESIIRGAEKDGYISIKDYQDKMADLEFIQPNHAIRKKTLYPKVLAMRLMQKTVPEYKVSELMKFSKKVSVKQSIRTFLGTIKRILNGKLD